MRHGKEHRILINTIKPWLAALQREVKSVRRCAIAEIIEFKIDSDDPDYLDWTSASTQ